MKILFVSSGTAQTSSGISPIIRAQGESLKALGHEVDYFGISKGGIRGYLSSILKIRKKIKSSNAELIHAHYALSGFSTTIALFGIKKPMVVSLMGDDVISSRVSKVLSRLCIKYFWSETIVKSNEMKDTLWLPQVHVLPNGVNLEKFKPLIKREVREFVGVDKDVKLVLFPSDPKRYEKNFDLFQAVLDLLKSQNSQFEWLPLKGVDHNDIPKYINACDVVLLTSRWEGSPNIVKESMACNVPVISTPVGDVKWLFGDCEYNYKAVSFDSQELAEAINYVFEKKAQGIVGTDGRQHLRSLRLDDLSVGNRLIALYTNILKE